MQTPQTVPQQVDPVGHGTQAIDKYKKNPPAMQVFYYRNGNHDWVTVVGLIILF